MLLGSYIHDS